MALEVEINFTGVPQAFINEGGVLKTALYLGYEELLDDGITPNPQTPVQYIKAKFEQDIINVYKNVWRQMKIEEVQSTINTPFE
jgi:hypothetical protein